MISDEAIRRVYKQAVSHDYIRVPGKIMAELLREVADARGVKIDSPALKAWTDNDVLNFLKGFKA